MRLMFGINNCTLLNLLELEVRLVICKLQEINIVKGVSLRNKRLRRGYSTQATAFEEIVSVTNLFLRLETSNSL